MLNENAKSIVIDGKEISYREDVASSVLYAARRALRVPDGQSLCEHANRCFEFARDRGYVPADFASITPITGDEK